MVELLPQLLQVVTIVLVMVMMMVMVLLVGIGSGFMECADTCSVPVAAGAGME